MIDEDAIKKKREEAVEALRSFKTTEGYKVLTDLVRNEQVARLSEWMSGETKEYHGQVKLQAEMKAWTSVLELLDDTITTYDQWLEQTLKQQQAQREQAINMQAHIYNKQLESARR